MISKRHPQLDGLRAIAIALVIAYHSYLPMSRGGFIGVDIFFVLSGFLISSIIAREVEATGKFDFLKFSIRRGVRLFPGLALMAALIAGYLWLWNSTAYNSNQYDLLTTLTYSTNWFRAYSLHEPNLYLGHTWSLAIEQQFYIFWPILVIGSLGTKEPILNIVRITLGIFFLCLLWRCFLIFESASVNRVYFGFDTRVDGIMLGCILGLVLNTQEFGLLSQNQAKNIAAFLRIPAILIIALEYFHANHENANFYIYELGGVNIAAGCIIADIFLNHKSWPAKILATRWIAEIGVVSYGVYLWHYPLFRIMHDLGYNKSAVIFTIGGSLSIALAAISYYYFERPIQQAWGRRYLASKALPR